MPVQLINAEILSKILEFFPFSRFFISLIKYKDSLSFRIQEIVTMSPGYALLSYEFLCSQHILCVQEWRQLFQ